MGAVKVWMSREDDHPIIKATVKRATETCNMFCNIATKRVEKLCYAFYHPRVKPVSQQTRLLQVAWILSWIKLRGSHEIKWYTVSVTLFFLHQLFATCDKYRFYRGYEQCFSSIHGTSCTILQSLSTQTFLPLLNLVTHMTQVNSLYPVSLLREIKGPATNWRQ